MNARYLCLINLIALACCCCGKKHAPTSVYEVSDAITLPLQLNKMIGKPRKTVESSVVFFRHFKHAGRNGMSYENYVADGYSIHVIYRESVSGNDQEDILAVVRK